MICCDWFSICLIGKLLHQILSFKIRYWNRKRSLTNVGSVGSVFSTITFISDLISSFILLTRIDESWNITHSLVKLTVYTAFVILFIHHKWFQEIRQIQCSIFCSLFSNLDSIWTALDFLSIFPTTVDTSISDETIGRINQRSLDNVNKTVQVESVPVRTWPSWISWPLHFEALSLPDLICFKNFYGFHTSSKDHMWDHVMCGVK